MAVHLITGFKGEEHIQSADQGSFNASFFGGGEFVMEAGNQCEASIINNNTVRVLDGDILMKGRHIRIPYNTYIDMNIQTGTAGVNRNDMIVMEYSKDSATGIETADLKVIRGVAVEGTATDPAFVQGDILGGANLNQMPLYRVKIEGVVLASVEQLFTAIPTYKTLAEQYATEFQQACESHLGSLNILDSMEEIEANTQENQLAGALGVKEGFAQINESLTLDYSNTREGVKDLNTFLQLALNKLFPNEMNLLSILAEYGESEFLKEWEGGTGSVSLTRTSALYRMIYTGGYQAGTGVVITTPQIDVSGYSKLTINCSLTNPGDKNEIWIYVNLDGVDMETINSSGETVINLENVNTLVLKTKMRNVGSSTATTRQLDITTLNIK